MRSEVAPRSVTTMRCIRRGLLLVAFLSAEPVDAAAAKVYCIEPTTPPPGCPTSGIPEVNLADAFIDANNDTLGSDQIILANQRERMPDCRIVWRSRTPERTTRPLQRKSSEGGD
jgi:hypothetical protein